MYGIFGMKALGSRAPGLGTSVEKVQSKPFLMLAMWMVMFRVLATPETLKPTPPAHRLPV